ncbi:group II intron maturase-specific domain-containing protein [Mycobacterium kubicae]|nr:group II intron maturase-specific domain-containing protein [Mycobacterium kubicae]
MSITDKVRNLTRRHKHRTLADLLRQLNPVLRGWCNYFQHGVSKRTFDYLDHFTWWRVVTWMRKRHHGLAWASSIDGSCPIGKSAKARRRCFGRRR